ncbi:hypothetical protein K466DRAFT_570327 [Polyporus arcularius HHB13444]|uniref:Uncharacterized protein n=1 Tax=Polyporus arcularius HHB13444 TaxID=1314778 RepID=A0A5C3NSC0_9APHY|nr:hypothetical protein K466DRAFT_570327 [Polyporus arcularius HHB13444]
MPCGILDAAIGVRYSDHNSEELTAQEQLGQFGSQARQPAWRALPSSYVVVFSLLAFMSILTGNHTIMPAMWPAGLECSETCSFDIQVRGDNYRYILESLDEPCSPARRVPIHGVSRDGVLQGFLGRSQLSMLGNWKVHEKDAASAVQYLVLKAGGCTKAFQMQIAALNNLKQYICMKLGASADNREFAGDSVYLERQVFTKVCITDVELRPVSSHSNLIQLHGSNDPQRHAWKIAHKWAIDYVRCAGAHCANTENMAIAVEVLSPGDFVEVSVSANISAPCRRGQGAKGMIVHFVMHEVVYLWTAQEVQYEFSRRWSQAERSSILAAKKKAVTQMLSGFCIGEKRAVDVLAEEGEDTEMSAKG